jgi:hypothetical protein
VEVFYVLDLDRCLINSDKLLAVLLEIIERDAGISPEEINIARRECKEADCVFDIVDYVMGSFDGRGLDGPAKWNSIKRDFINESHHHEMLAPHARDLLAALDKRKMRYGIVTYGMDVWQLAKIAAAGLGDIPHAVTHDVVKGHLISSWQLASGHFLIPRALSGTRGLVAEHVVFVDDKPISFDALPPEVIGICALAPGVMWSSEQLSRLPSNVTVVEGIKGVISLLERNEYYINLDKT